jgi:hypothetical protein
MLLRALPLVSLITFSGMTLQAAQQPRLKPSVTDPLPRLVQLPKQVDPEMPYFLVVAEACDDCARVCEITAMHCAVMLKKGDAEHFEVMRLTQDCAAICTAAGRVAAKDGPMKHIICVACADACKRCADECAKHKDDAMMTRCAEECRKCEAICRKMNRE